MLFDHVAIGGGVIGFNVTFNIVNYIINSKNICNKSFNFAIIDKKITNLYGGVAYNIENSIFGYFNNPIRLSPDLFISFLKNNQKFQNEIKNNLKKYNGYVDKLWLENSYKFLNTKDQNKFSELYLPRSAFGLWQKYRLNYLHEKIYQYNKKNDLNNYINLIYIENNVHKLDFKFNNFIKIVDQHPKNYYAFNHKEKKFENKNNNIFCEEILSANVTLGLGLNPPKDIQNNNSKKIKNYISNFYEEGSTKNLINLVKNYFLLNKNKTLKLSFIGVKAGLLESLPELFQLIINNDYKIKITAFSSSLVSLEKAEFNKLNKKYKFKYLIKKNLSRVNKANLIIKFIKKEFQYATSLEFTKYDVWTKILKENILINLIKNLDKKEKLLYDRKYFNELRNITRFTYSYPIEIKDKMTQMKLLTMKKSKIYSIYNKNNKIYLKSKNQEHSADIAVNVSGPLKTSKIKNELFLVKNLHKYLQFHSSGFIVDKNYASVSSKNLYLPGVLASGFNPNRLTIIKAILNNSNKSSNKIFQKLERKNYNKIYLNYYLFLFKNYKNKYVTKGGISASSKMFNMIFDNISLNKYLHPNIKLIFDGKAGTGKSTLSRIIAEIYKTVSIDTGYIFKSLSMHLYKKGYRSYNLENIKINECLDYLKKIELKDLANNKLNNQRYLPITNYLAKNKKIRTEFNYSIKKIIKNFDSFILTGRDTGKILFENDQKVKKLFLLVPNYLIKSRYRIKYKTSDDKIISRNKNDKQNILMSKDALVIHNNSTIEKTIQKIIKKIIS